jgi:hypothetical protein
MVLLLLLSLFDCEENSSQDVRDEISEHNPKNQFIIARLGQRTAFLFLVQWKELTFWTTNRTFVRFSIFKLPVDKIETDLSSASGMTERKLTNLAWPSDWIPFLDRHVIWGSFDLSFDLCLPLS